MKEGANTPIVKIDTGLSGLDEYLDGGFPRPGIVYVIGQPGVGKTTLSVQYLIYRANKGENGLYVSTSEPLPSVQGRYIGFYFYEDLIRHLKEEKILFVDLIPRYGQSTETIFRSINLLEEIITERNVKNLVIDSIAGLTQYMTAEESRTLLSQLIEKAHKHKLTMLLIDELPLYSKVAHMALGEFLSDLYIIIDYALTETGKIVVRLIVLKSRYSKTTREPLMVDITKESGFHIVGPLATKHMRFIG